MNTIVGSLTATGWTDWTEVHALLGDDACLWVDLGGAHAASAPAILPIATHLWAWRPGRWTRVRLDGKRVLATILREGDHSGERVVAVPAEGVPWGHHDRAAHWEPAVTLLTTQGTGSITFARLSGDR